MPDIDHILNGFADERTGYAGDHAEFDPPAQRSQAATVGKRTRSQPATASNDPPAQTLTSETAEGLMTVTLPAARWVVPGLIAEGACLLGGRPKSGKSQLALQLAAAVTTGEPAWGWTVCPRVEALYVALEDGRRRVQQRLRHLCGEKAPAGLHLMYAVPTLGKGLAAELRAWLDLHPAVRLVVIDTLTRVRDRVFRNNAYEGDYDAVAPFSALGQERGITNMLLCHTRKASLADDTGDPFDDISGTLGLSAAADSMMVLKRPPLSSDAKLHVRGRDVDERTMDLSWDAEHLLWAVADPAGAKTEAGRLLEYLRENGPSKAMAVAQGLGKGYEAVRRALQRMAREGMVEADGKGLFRYGGGGATPGHGSRVAVSHCDLTPFEDES